MARIRWSSRCTWIILAGCLPWFAGSPGAIVAQAKQAEPTLASLIPADAAFVLQVRPAELGKAGYWQRLPAPLRSSLLLGLALDDAKLESITFVQPGLDERQKDVRPDIKKAPVAVPTAPSDGPKPDCEAQPKGIELNVPWAQLTILRTTAPVDAGILRGAEVDKYKGQTVYLNSHGDVALALMGPRTLVITRGRREMARYLDSPRALPAGLKEAVGLGDKGEHALVFGAAIAEPSRAEWKRRFGRELLDQGYGGPGLVGVYRALAPLMELRSATCALDVTRAQARVTGTIEFADAKRARESVGAVQDALVLARLFPLGHLWAELNLAEEEFEGSDAVEGIHFWKLFLARAETALRQATVEPKDAELLVRLVADVDQEALAAEAKKNFQARAGDEVFQEARRRRISANNLKQIMLALHSTHDDYKYFPAQAIHDRDTGKPLLSWRVHILPYIEEVVLYREFKLDEPWDSPHNLKLLPRMPKVYAPVGVKTKEPHTTFYQAFVGKGAAFEPLTPEQAKPLARGIKMLHFTDGTSNTAMIAEAGEPVPWTKPADLVYDDKQPLPKLGGLFKDGFHLGFADGTARYVRRTINEVTLRALITRAGGEIIQEP